MSEYKPEWRSKRLPDFDFDFDFFPRFYDWTRVIAKSRRGFMSGLDAILREHLLFFCLVGVFFHHGQSLDMFAACASNLVPRWN